jgi:predicted RNA-binding Zn-ribbon protein involved in translation (DUF1610 family)
MGQNTAYPAWVWLSVAGVVFLGALALLLWGLFGDRSKGRPRCPKCWYDMTGNLAAGRLACPECGYEAISRKRLFKNHRRWWAIGAGLVLLVGPYAYPASILGGWYWEKRIRASLRDMLSGRVDVTCASVGPHG